MSRTIPAALQVHLNQSVTTTCRLLRLQLRDGRVFGVTSLDADVTYNDGRGAVTYSANQGVDVSAISASADMTVANAEAQSLLVTTPTGITEAMIEAGELRDAEWTLYLVNYRDLSAGHIILGAGDVGEVTKRWGLVWTPELLSYSVRLNQPVGTHWSRTCRAIDGSPADSQTGCGRTITQIPGAVTAVGVETDRQFTGNHAAGTFPLAPGRVLWVTGQNAGRTGFVEVHTSGAVTLGNAMPYPITAGDTYTISDTCPRTWAACVARANQLNFKGEPLIPTGDAASVSTPGAQAPTGEVLTQVTGSTVQASSAAITYPPSGSAEPQSVTGNLLAGYVGAPYLLIPAISEGLVFSRPGPSSYWTANASSGMPENVCFSSSGMAVGCPAVAGTYNWTGRFNQLGFPPISASGTVSILASPSATVWNAMDRQVDYGSVRMLAGPAPMLQIEGLPFALSGTSAGSIRALNGYSSGRRYWEVTINEIPDSPNDFVLGLGIDRSRNGNLVVGAGYNTQGLGSDSTAGEWGYQLSRRNGGQAAAVVVARGQQNKVAPAVVAGDVLRFVHDVSYGRLWVGIAGKGWIGGGSPDANTLPTISGITPEPAARWADYRPLAVLGGGVIVTANFGSQAWTGGGITSGASIIPFASQPEFAQHFLDTDTVTVDPGTTAAMLSVSGPVGGAVYSPELLGSYISQRNIGGLVGTAPSVRGHLPKSAGKWQVEFYNFGWQFYSWVGLAPVDWDASAQPAPGDTVDSFGVRPAGNVTGNADGTIKSANVAVGAIAGGGSVITLAVDLDASPKTVRVLRDGVAVGTYNLPATGRPWVPVMAAVGFGGAAIRARGLTYPQAGFMSWAP